MRTRLFATAIIGSIAAFGMVSANAAPPSAVTPSIAFASGSGFSSTVSPSLGSSVAFATVYPSTTKNPSVEVNCYQNGVLVWGRVGAPGDTVLLGGGWSPWVVNGGSAQCTATLEDIVWVHKMEQVSPLAGMSFSANA